VRDFESRCLELIDLITETGEQLVITRRGKPIARLLPVEASRGLRGSIVWEKDLVAPADDRW